MLKDSIYPVYGKDYDDIGVVDLKSIFILMMKINLSQIMTEAPFIMEHTTAYKALERFKKTGIHYAFVADEYGIFKES
jgi:putative hemolysin